MLILSFVWLAIGREEILGVPVFLFIALGMLALKLFQSGEQSYLIDNKRESKPSQQDIVLLMFDASLGLEMETF